MMRTDESLLNLHGDALLHGRIPLRILPGIDACMQDMAAAMVAEIERNNAAGRPTLLIVPVGPVMQYPHFVELVNRRRLSLAHVTFINMDEYMQDETTPLPPQHPLSFRGFMQRSVYGQIDPTLLMPEAQRVFPMPGSAAAIDALIAAHGGVDVCFGGIGINGHVAFNEPPEAGDPIGAAEFMRLSVRLQKVSRETKVVNSISDLGGAYENIPDHCVTVGFKEILQAKKIRLYCFRSWQKAVVRKAAFGEPDVHFPVSLLQQHADVEIVIPLELA
jgi:glucosamine-6-phosphate deaminase